MEFTAKSEGAHRGEAAAKESKMSFRRKVTVRRSGNRSDEKQPRIDTNGHELIPLFASICVHSRLENPRKKKESQPVECKGKQRRTWFFASMDPPSLSCGKQGVIDKAMADRLQMNTNQGIIIRVHWCPFAVHRRTFLAIGDWLSAIRLCGSELLL
jgi:hypothetical protein